VIGVDAEIQVLAQAPFAQRHVEIDVRRADQPEVHVDDAIAADRPVFALLAAREQLGLEVRRHLADFIEQQRSALGHLEQAFLVHRRAGEGAFLVAKQLGLDEILRNGGAVDLDEGPLERLLL
jgi:hypothetical protein